MERLTHATLTDVRALATKLAKRYAKRDVVIGLSGNLGSGKTTFTKEFAKALGIHRVKSPTFVIGSRYKLPGRLLYHYDFYRLHSAKQLTDLGFDEILKQHNRIVLIEWVEKMPKIKKQCDLVIKFKVAGINLRNVEIR